MQLDDALYIDLVMSMNNFIVESVKNSTKIGILFQYYKHVPAVDNYGDVTDFTGAIVSDSFNL